MAAREMCHPPRMRISVGGGSKRRHSMPFLILHPLLFWGFFWASVVRGDGSFMPLLDPSSQPPSSAFPHSLLRSPPLPSTLPSPSVHIPPSPSHPDYAHRPSPPSHPTLSSAPWVKGRPFPIPRLRSVRHGRMHSVMQREEGPREMRREVFAGREEGGGSGRGGGGAWVRNKREGGRMSGKERGGRKGGGGRGREEVTEGPRRCGGPDARSLCPRSVSYPFAPGGSRKWALGLRGRLRRGVACWAGACSAGGWAGGVGGWGGRLEWAGVYALLSMLLGVVDVGGLELGSFTTWAFRQRCLFLVVPSERLLMQCFSGWEPSRAGRFDSSWYGSVTRGVC